MTDYCILLTDFGNKDNFTGVMKGVISKICPGTRFIDLCNEIPQGDIYKAYFQLVSAYKYMPAAVYLIVVDPGVGSNRNALIAKYGDSFFVAPDNGVLTHFIKNKADVYKIKPHDFMPENISTTFHGRDIFAPTAGALLKGINLELLSEPFSAGQNPILLELREPVVLNNKIIASIQYIDNFGNLFTNIPGLMLEHKKLITVSISLNGKVLSNINSFYSEIETGFPGALIGSSGYVEIFVRNGNAKNYFNAETGNELIIEFR